MDANRTRLFLAKEPKPIKPAEAYDKPIVTMVAGCILNPFGPTLTAVFLSDEPRPGAKLSVYYQMLHPFQQELQVVGQVIVGDDWNLKKIIPKFFSFEFGACPTLLLANKQLPKAEAAEVYADFLLQFPDSGSEFQKIQRHFGDPDTRFGDAQVDMNEIMRLILSGEEPPGPRPMLPLADRGEAVRFASTLLQEAHMKPEIALFMGFWTGSIEQQRENGTLHLLGPLLDTETFAEYFLMIMQSCHVPKLV